MVVPVRINRRGARLQPHAWLARRRRDRLSNDTCRQHTRLHDLVSIGFRVTAVDAAAGQIDHDVAAVNLTLPVAEGRAIPRDDPPRTPLRLSAEHGDIVAAMVKRSRQDRADLSGPTWNDNLHVALPVYSMNRPRNSGRGARHCSKRPNTRYRFRAMTS